MATRRAKPPAGPNSKSDKLQEFYTSLADKLEALEQAVQPKWLTLEWVSLAVDFMRSIFSEMMILFEDVHADVKANRDEYWIEEYMVESMKLLDVCNVLKPAVSRFEHFIMCVHLVVPAIQRCAAGESQDETLISALRSCEAELNELVRPPLLTIENSSNYNASDHHHHQVRSTDALLRHASIAMGESFTDENLIDSSCSNNNNNNNAPVVRSAMKSGRGAVALALVMRATRETTDFVASVLIWALKRDPASHPASSAWQNQNMQALEGSPLWSPSFRRLQERLRKELLAALRSNNRHRRCFLFEELRMVEDCTAVLKAEVERGAPSQPRLDALVHDLSSLLDTIQIRLEKVSSQVNRLFDELVQARKKLLDATQQRPGTIHRAHTF